MHQVETQEGMQYLQKAMGAAEVAGRQITLKVTEFPAVRLQREPIAYAEQPKYSSVSRKNSGFN